MCTNFDGSTNGHLVGNGASYGLIDDDSGFIIVTAGEDDNLHKELSRQSSSKRFLRSHNKDVKRRVRRLIKKSGKSTLIRSTIPFRSYRYFLDLGNTLVNSRWRWTLILLASSFIITWLLFACFWMLISNSNGDFDPTSPSETPCLTGIEGFAGFFLFSLETQATIGYGSRSINHHCPEGTFIMVLQIIMGSAVCGGMVSIVYVKMARPLSDQRKRLFSSNAVICQRDGILCLIFRVRDEDNRHIVGTTINAYIVENKEHEPVLYEIQLDPPGILIWPLDIVHKITEISPFWDFSAKDLIYKKFELIVTMQGTSVTTGQCSKTRTSYLSTEILWGRRFKPCVKFNNEKRAYYIDHKEFNETEEVLTPLCSAQRMEEVLTDIHSPKEQSVRLNSIFNFDNIIAGMEESSRLLRRRSTVVLTEINKSIEILDTSDSEEEVASPEILISHAENIPIPSLDYNSTRRNSNQLMFGNSNETTQARENNRALYQSNEQENGLDFVKKPSRRISFDSNVQSMPPPRPFRPHRKIDNTNQDLYPAAAINNKTFKVHQNQNFNTRKSTSNENIIASGENIIAGAENIIASGENMITKGDNIVASGDNNNETGDHIIKSGDTIIESGDNIIESGKNDGASTPNSSQVFNYLNEIKDKVFQPRRPLSSPAKQEVSNIMKDTIDIEKLIESLEQYVQENSY